MIRLVALCVVFLAGVNAFSQAPSITLFELKKPDSLKEKKLGSEKMAEKRFTAPRHFFQNNFTHYNYYFNANEKIKTIIANAKKQFKDDYTSLIPFYNYTHDATKSQGTDLDSVLDKTSTGILIHDLRNDWIDNLFLLMGKAFYFRKDYDSALMTFQYMTVYYKPGVKDDYSRLIGSNRNKGESALSIASKEKRNTVQKIFTKPPSYNDALIWQTRSYIEMKQYGNAISLIEALRGDANFPKRLKVDFEELMAYYYYRVEQYDSSAKHLINALPNAQNKNEKARWEFLIGQMLALSGKPADAQEYFDKSISHTYDPVLDVYARLNQIMLAKSKDKNIIQQNIDELERMARKERYEAYRGIIYFTAAKIEMQRDNFDGAEKFLRLSVKYSAGDADMKDKAYLYFGDLAFDKKKYELAYNCYDSIGSGASQLPSYDRAMERKSMLADAIYYLKRIGFEDSLQRIAAMPEAERKIFLKKLLKQLRKEQGLKEEEAALDKYLNVNQNTYGNNLFNTKQYQNQYQQTQTTYSGWYFANQDLKSRGFTAFKQKWGNRPNLDNWRREEAVGKGTGSLISNNNKADSNNQPRKEYNNLGNVKVEDLTIDILEASLPLTAVKLKTSNDTLQFCLLAVGRTYMNKVEDYASAAEIFERIVKKFDTLSFPDETYFNLYYCYNKIGDKEKAQYYKDLLSKLAPNSKYAKLLNKQQYIDTTAIREKVATKKYEDVYNAFIEGRFEEAIVMKRQADSVYGLHHWTPQLLYIEALYYVKQREDSIAISRFDILKQAFPESPLADKASRFIDVLRRRKEIEDYLTNLKVERVKEDAPIVVKDELPPRKVLVQDSTTVKKPDIKPAVAQNNQPTVKDSAVKAPPKIITKGKFEWNPADSQYVAVILNKVDVIYSREAENAFKRYNGEQYYNQQYTTSLSIFSPDDRILLIGPFANAADAIAYMDKAKRMAKNDIIPWLAPAKYSFLVFSKGNLTALYQNNDLPTYRKFLQEVMPGKF